MTDDPRWQGTGYSPEKAWAEIKSADRKRELEARFPTKWWHDIVFGWGGMLVLGIVLVCAVSLLFDLSGFLRRIF